VTANPTQSLEGKVAVVAGASRGIGRAIARALARCGATLCLVGRDRDALAETRDGMPEHASHVLTADLTIDDEVRRVSQFVAGRLKRADILVHSAGLYIRGALSSASIDDFDRLYRANVRAPYLLTQDLVSLLIANHGQIVFINSTQALKTTAELSQYGATQHALTGIADSLRDELNADGVRVLSVYTGRTATPRTERLYRQQGTPYRPELLMQPGDVADAVVNALLLPRTAEVTEIRLRPLLKSY
jgi:NADP-dependent 3-hydroxy acid dehydrogenase YdfG